MISVQNDKLVDFDHLPLYYSLKLVEHNKLEYILTYFKPPPCLVSEIYAF